MYHLKQKLLQTFFGQNAFFANSFIAPERLRLMRSLLRGVVEKGIPGDVVECGVYKGGSLIELGRELKEINSNKILYGLDTFKGHPYTEAGTVHVKGHLSDTSYNEVLKIMYREKLSNIKLLRGSFLDSFQKLGRATFCFAHVDCNLYISYKQCLEFLLPRMEKSGIIFFEDYNCPISPNAKKAVLEHIDEEDLIVLPKKQAYFIVK